MKKQKHVETSTIKGLFILTIMTGIVFAFIIFIICNNILPFKDNNTIYVLSAVILVFLLLSSFLGIIASAELLILAIFYFKNAEKSYKESLILIEMEKFLSTSNFTEVTLRTNNLSMIPKEKFICKARLDEDGNIIYNVSLNFETKTDDYENFLKHFDVEN